jgi:tRNA G18 (ribose-2'-O)-methylase SpoU
MFSTSAQGESSPILRSRNNKMAAAHPLGGRLTAIDDADDPRVAGFRDIRERDLRRAEGRFIAEGTVVLRVLSEVHGGPQGFEAESILVLDSRVAGASDILAAFPPDVPIMIAPREVIDRIAGFPLHRGILAVGRHRPLAAAGDLLQRLPERALVVAGQGISNHDNMGGLFRNAAVFGADAALFDERSCDPLYRKAIRVSVGGALRVPFHRGGSIDGLVCSLEANGFELWGLSPRGEVPIERAVPGKRVALLAGTEGEGLPTELMARIRTARIAQAPGMDSLNVATASGIALHHMALAMGRIS